MVKKRTKTPKKSVKNGESLWDMIPYLSAVFVARKRMSRAAWKQTLPFAILLLAEHTARYVISNKLNITEKERIKRAFWSEYQLALTGMRDYLDEQGLDRDGRCQLHRSYKSLCDRIKALLWQSLDNDSFNDFALEELAGEFNEFAQNLGFEIGAYQVHLPVDKQSRRAVPKKRNERTTKLTDFIHDRCEETPSIQSKVNRIHEFVKKGKISFMPKPVNNPKGNETKLYSEEALRQVWPKLKDKIKSLPNLKD
jgi:hypothetical protein